MASNIRMSIDNAVSIYSMMQMINSFDFFKLNFSIFIYLYFSGSNKLLVLLMSGSEDLSLDTQTVIDLRLSVCIYQTVTFDNAVVNIPNVFNPATGHFTCKTPGVYYFSFHSMAKVTLSLLFCGCMKS